MSESQRPAWFEAALARQPEKHVLTVAGAEIAYRTWGERGDPAVLLVHGRRAHGHWWDHIAPALADGRRVVAVDLSGHGHSAWRAHYDVDVWAEELATVLVAEAGGPAVLVGHSVGGLPVLRAAARHPELVSAATVIDTAVLRDPEEEAAVERALHRQAAPVHRVHPTREEAVSRYRLTPAHPVLDYVRDHVAAHSLRPADGGWTWRFDPGFPGLGPADRVHLPVACPVAVLRPEHGLMTRPYVEKLAAELGGPCLLVEVPDAGHHVLLDQPIALVTALQSLLPLLPLARREPVDGAGSRVQVSSGRSAPVAEPRSAPRWIT